MSTYRKLMTFGCAAVLALGLAACGGGGGSDTADTPTMTDPPDPAPTPAEEIVALVAQINALRAELGMDPVDIDALEGDVASLQGQVTDLQGQIATRDAAIAAAARAAMTAQGRAVFGVLEPLGNATTAADSAISPVATAPTVMARYGSTSTVRVTDTTDGVSQEEFVDGLTAAGIDATANTAFTSAEAGAPEMLDANGGFSGTMLTWEDRTRADTMVVYTDVGSPRGVLFSERYGGGGQTITSASGGGLNAAQTGVTGMAFDGRTGGLVEHDANAKSATTVAENDVVKLAGAYKGAMGSYTCTPADANACTSTVNTNGSITFSAGDGTNGTWTFTANTGAMVSVTDTSYMTFGWWMRNDKTTADLLDNVAVFYNAPPYVTGTVTDTNLLTGTANYEGGAAGKYAWRDVDEGTAHGGHFTAKASLTARFTTGAAGDTLSGSISEFDIGDGTDPNWTVMLGQADIAGAGTVARTTGADDSPWNTIWAVGGNRATAAGSWEAGLSNSGARRNDNLPTGVAGAFNAEFGEQGRMLGAFGANITNANPPN